MSPSWCSVVPGRSHGLWSVLTVHKPRIERVRSAMASNPHSATSCECPITHAKGIGRNWALLKKGPAALKGNRPCCNVTLKPRLPFFFLPSFSLPSFPLPSAQSRITESAPASGRPTSDRSADSPSTTQPAAGLPRESMGRRSSADPDQQFSQAPQIPR